MTNNYFAKRNKFSYRKIAKTVDKILKIIMKSKNYLFYFPVAAVALLGFGAGTIDARTHDAKAHDSNPMGYDANIVAGIFVILGECLHDELKGLEGFDYGTLKDVFVTLPQHKHEDIGLEIKNNKELAKNVVECLNKKLHKK